MPNVVNFFVLYPHHVRWILDGSAMSWYLKFSQDLPVEAIVGGLLCMRMKATLWYCKRNFMTIAEEINLLCFIFKSFN